MASATGRNWWGVVPTGQLDSSGDNMADGSASYMQVGIDGFYEDVSGTQFTVAPHIYRWDRYDTNNSGGYFYEVLNPDPNNGNTAKTFGPLYWGSGSGTREIDSFGTRTYTKQINPFTVTYRMSGYNSGSAYSGYYHGVSDGYHDWTITIPGKVVGKVLTINPNGGVLKGDNFGSSEGTTQNATVILTTNRSYYSGLGTATKTGCIFNGGYTATNGGVQVFNAQGQALKGTYGSESAIETGAETRYIYDGDLTIYAQGTPTVTVSISGTPTVGNTLTASVATSSTGTKSYQGYYTSTANAASGTNISGATSSTYKVTSAVVGYYIGCKVTTAAVTGYRTSSGIKTTSAKATKANDLVRTFTLASGLTYDGSPKALVTAFTTASGSGKLGLGASSTSAPSTGYSNRSEVTGTAAGLYYVGCKTEGNASYNAMAATYKGSVTIKKATPTVTVTTYTSNQYAGSAVNLATATSSNCTYTLGYSKTSSTDSSTVTGLSANTPITSATSGIAKDTTYYIWYKATGATNYENIAATYKGTAKYTYGRNKDKIFFYDSAGTRRYANTYFYDENGIKHNITVSFFGLNGTSHNLKSVLSYNDNASGDLLSFTFEGITSYYRQTMTGKDGINSSYNNRGGQLKTASGDASKTTIGNAAGTAELGDEDCLGDFFLAQDLVIDFINGNGSEIQYGNGF